MNDTLYLAWRYLVYHRIKSAILVLAIALIVLIPAVLQVLVRQGQQQLTSRAVTTPLLLGAKGSPLELTLNSLYYGSGVPEMIKYGDCSDVAYTENVDAIPLHVRFRSQSAPIVGTSLEYFDFRGLSVQEGALLKRLGDCVVGANVARQRGLSAGDSVISSPESALGIADEYPLKMRITGVLASSATPDDDAIFVDLKTAWVIEGLGHGHFDLSDERAAENVLSRDGNKITANASVRQYQEVTDENIRSFHFHGRRSTFPITAVLALPEDRRSMSMLLGDYQDNDTVQLVRPVEVVEELLQTVFAIQNLVLTALVLTGAVTLLLVVVVFVLSLKQRAREIETMAKIGGSRGRILGVLATEVGFVIVLGVGIASGLTWLTTIFAPQIVQQYLMG
ncbi:FtsX-like permease family protein [Planctomycetes bacterium CA13]|uniref:FtsX-like permease family protein n=1 Tax=Novipirellula herctigrandis TaxID=2527986 RepID=A0A5C5Z3D9_9BACT|nr:FtsX-like permease family protein [Planctomycetes bacterium CA13]